MFDIVDALFFFGVVLIFVRVVPPSLDSSVNSADRRRVIAGSFDRRNSIHLRTFNIDKFKPNNYILAFDRPEGTATEKKTKKTLYNM